jgi:hypothetical protein
VSDYRPIRQAVMPMMLVGFVVGDFASDDRNWPMYGMGLAFAMWVGWVLAVVIGAAAVETWRARREGER